MQTVDVEVEPLAVPVHAGDLEALQRAGRRVVRLQHADRGHLDRSDDRPDGPLAQEVGQGLHLGQLRHGPTLRAGPTVGPWQPTGQGERESVRITIDAPAETVWSALREPHEIERWHGWHYDELEAEIDAIFLSDVTEHPEELTLDTNGGGRFELERADDADGPHTVLRIMRGIDQYGSDWDGGYDEIDEGWTTFVHQLRFLLERHPGQDRRTLRVDDDRPSRGQCVAVPGARPPGRSGRPGCRRAVPRRGCRGRARRRRKRSPARSGSEPGTRSA